MTPLSYCTNVHPAEDLPGVLAQLDRYAEPVREQLGADVLGLGLWLPAGMAATLAEDPASVRRLRSELDARGLQVHTLNAFPYGSFHADVVKHAVYHPTWTEPARLTYTLNCADVLAALLPDDAVYGSISTLPLAWREPWSPQDDALAAAALATLSAELGRRGKPIRLAVEPEPGCVLDTVADAVAWLAPRVDPRYVGLCLDTCHLAVSFADPAETVAQIARAGLSVVKVQASAALQVDRPRSAESRAALARFAEPRYLHQVRELTDDGVLAADDLPDAADRLPGDGPWRVHFHLPLHAAPADPLSSTTDVLVEALAALDDVPHVEVETYTWSVLPDGGEVAADDAALVRGIAAELAWAATHLPIGVR